MLCDEMMMILRLIGWIIQKSLDYNQVVALAKGILEKHDSLGYEGLQVRVRTWKWEVFLWPAGNWYIQTSVVRFTSNSLDISFAIYSSTFSFQFDNRTGQCVTLIVYSSWPIEEVWREKRKKQLDLLLLAFVNLVYCLELILFDMIIFIC